MSISKTLTGDPLAPAAPSFPGAPCQKKKSLFNILQLINYIFLDYFVFIKWGLGWGVLFILTEGPAGPAGPGLPGSPRAPAGPSPPRAP